MEQRNNMYREFQVKETNLTDISFEIQKYNLDYSLYHPILQPTELYNKVALVSTKKSPETISTYNIGGSLSQMRKVSNAIVCLVPHSNARAASANYKRPVRISSNNGAKRPASAVAQSMRPRSSRLSIGNVIASEPVVHRENVKSSRPASSISRMTLIDAKGAEIQKLNVSGRCVGLADPLQGWISHQKELNEQY